MVNMTIDFKKQAEDVYKQLKRNADLTILCGVKGNYVFEDNAFRELSVNYLQTVLEGTSASSEVKRGKETLEAMALRLAKQHLV